MKTQKELSRPLNLKSGKGVFLKPGVTGEMLGFTNNKNRGVAAQAVERSQNKKPTAFQDIIKPLLDEGMKAKDIATRTGKFPSFINTQIRQMRVIHGEEWYEKITNGK